MKKLVLLISAITIATLSSCSKLNDQPTGSFYSIVLTSIEMKEVDKNPVKWKLEYGNFDSSTPIFDQQFTTMPYLVKQTITDDNMEGSDIYQIKYEYSMETLTITNTTLDGEKSTDIYKLDNNHMAYETLGYGANFPIDITYTSDGFRKTVGDTSLSINNERSGYEYAMLGDEKVVDYTYSDTPNRIGLQQFGMFGSKYYWPTDRFGHQSQYLLEEVNRIEDGETVKYEFGYIGDSNYLVSEEKIYRNGKLFMTNSYKYEVVVITLK